MQRREFVAVILFTMLMCLQTIDLHAFSHCEDDHNEIECNLCALTIDQQQEAYLPPSPAELPEIFEGIHSNTIVFFDRRLVPILAKRKHRVRPPPALS